MEVVTDSERLRRYRRTIVELLFTERNHVCSVCVSNGHCELQTLAQTLGMTHVHLPYLRDMHRVDATHERFVVDHNRCVLCTRCVRVCDEIEGAHTWDVLGRGTSARVITDLNQPWGTSETCTGCGKCVHVCPTGALSEKGKSVQEMLKRIAVPAVPDADARTRRRGTVTWPGGDADADHREPMKPTLATVWLDGCSGCHMSLLDMDERLLEILLARWTSSTARWWTPRCSPRTST